jgi:hypothetical protein
VLPKEKKNPIQKITKATGGITQVPHLKKKERKKEKGSK